MAACVWCSGGFVLLYKAYSMAVQARQLTQDTTEILLVLIAGFVIGILKVRFIFNHFCTRNLTRIESLSQPKIWQCFRPGFLLFLALMILFGKVMTAMAEGNYLFLLGMAILDMSLAVALLGSSLVFWNNRTVGFRVKGQP